MSTPETASESRRPRRFAGDKLVRVTGLLVAVVAIVLCARALSREWSTVSSAVAHANAALLVLAFVLEALAMIGLGILWCYCVRVFAGRVEFGESVAWYFAGELGKYLPGGVWSVLGRGELAARSGRVTRSDVYGTTLIGYAMMCIGAAYVCAAIAPALAAGDGLGWGWILVALVPIGVTVLHPAVLGRVLSIVRRVTRGRVDYEAPSWSKMLGLSAVAIPTWVLVGSAAALVTAAFGFHQDPARVAFAAVAAWILGFLVLPVPAGAGVRELIFVAICGLGPGHGIIAAAGARVLLIAVDAVGGVAALWDARRRVRGVNSSSGLVVTNAGPR